MKTKYNDTFEEQGIKGYKHVKCVASSVPYFIPGKIYYTSLAFMSHSVCLQIDRDDCHITLGQGGKFRYATALELSDITKHHHLTTSFDTGNLLSVPVNKE